MMNADRLVGELAASRERLARVTTGLDGARLLGPKLAIVNPPLWELGHIAWFQEYWCLRRSTRGLPDSILKGADALFDSAKVAHDTRWDLPLPDLKTTRGYQAEVMERVARRIEAEPENDQLHYFVQLAVFHEDMHAEAFHYTRQTLGYENPFAGETGAPSTTTRHSPSAPPAGDAELPGGPFLLGATQNDGFVFDNEKWVHEIRLQPFRISRTTVTNAEYLGFVEASGYSRREWWDEDGWAWKIRAGRLAPQYWERRDGLWARRTFDHVDAMQPHAPVIHVNWHEAQAYCRYANRRLPTEAEWEYAASRNPRVPEKTRYPWGNDFPTHDRANLESAGMTEAREHAAGDSASGCRQMIGNVWEWTASTFESYPGFVVDPYQEYSQPWFGTHKVLRGGSFATPRRLIRNTWRNFYTPDRSDIFAGFRTCAMEK